MVEQNRNNQQEKKGEEVFNIRNELLKINKVDLIGIDPTTLSLREKLRQRRQHEALGNNGLPQLAEYSQNQLEKQVPKQKRPNNITGEQMEPPRLSVPPNSSESTSTNSEQKLVNTLRHRKEEFNKRQRKLELAFNNALDGYEDLLTNDELEVTRSALNKAPSTIYIPPERQSNLMYKARKKIEHIKLEPNEIFRLGKLITLYESEKGFTAQMLSNAAYRRSLPAINFANRVYSTRKLVEWSEQTKIGYLTDSLKATGLTVANSTFSKKDLRIISTHPRFADYIHKINGVFYVNEKDVETILAQLHPPDDTYAPLTDLVENSRERQRLKVAISRGRLEAILQRGTYITTKEAIAKYETSVADTYKRRRKAT